MIIANGWKEVLDLSLTIYQCEMSSFIYLESGFRPKGVEEQDIYHFIFILHSSLSLRWKAIASPWYSGAEVDRNISRYQQKGCRSHANRNSPC